MEYVQKVYEFKQNRFLGRLSLEFVLKFDQVFVWGSKFNPFNAELNPVCHLLALLGAHHIFHVGRIRVKYDQNYNRQHNREDDKPKKIRTQAYGGRLCVNVQETGAFYSRWYVNEKIPMAPSGIETATIRLCSAVPVPTVPPAACPQSFEVPSIKYDQNYNQQHNREDDKSKKLRTQAYGGRLCVNVQETGAFCSRWHATSAAQYFQNYVI